MTTSSSIPSPRVPIEIGAQLRLRSPEPKALCAQQSLPEQRPDQLAFQHAPDAVEGGEDRGEDIGRLGRGLLVILPGLAGLVLDRKSVGEGKSVSVRVDLVGRRSIKKKNKKRNTTHIYHK